MYMGNGELKLLSQRTQRGGRSMVTGGSFSPWLPVLSRVCWAPWEVVSPGFSAVSPHEGSPVRLKHTHLWDSHWVQMGTHGGFPH